MKMKIKNFERKIPYGELEGGKLFEFEGDVCIKPKNKDYNPISIKTGDERFPKYHTIVKPHIARSDLEGLAFNELHNGECFEYEDELFIKTPIRGSK